MKCAYCHTTRFGLARYQLLTLKGYVYFDRKRCRDDYLKAIQEDLNRKALIESAYQQEPTGEETPQHSGVNLAAAPVRQIPSHNILISSCAEQRKLTEEAAQCIRSDENTELSQVAVSVSEDLWGFIGGEDTAMELHQNQIIVSVTKKTVEITCIGPDSFRLMGDNIGAQVHKDGQRQVYVEPRRSANDSETISKSEVVRTVTAWVRERRAA
jgi:hypothetical protein